jgi:hypothetical protein
MANVELAPRTLLDTAPGTFGMPWELWHIGAGWHVAGSGVRWQERDTYLVTRRRPNGTTWGQHYGTEREAREYFDTYTTPVVAVEGVR